jgi:hypothetical protein
MTVPVSALALSMCHHLMMCLPLAAMLFGAGTFLGYRGRGLERGVLPGLLAGVLPLIGMSVAHLGGHTCGPGLCSSTCLLACTVAGLLAGFLATRLFPGHADVNGQRLGVVTVGALTLAMGCAATGLGGTLGLMVGVFFGLAPQLSRAPSSPTRSG